MSIDTSDQARSQKPASGKTPQPPSQSDQWESLCEKIKSRSSKAGAASVFGKSAKGGGVYRWGITASTGHPCGELLDFLSRAACGGRSAKNKAKSIDFDALADACAEWINSTLVFSSLDSTTAVLWGAALPTLASRLDPSRWWRLLSSLQQLHESILQRCNAYAPAHLILGGELGLTLAWRLRDLASCKSLQRASIEAVREWCAREDESIAAAIARGTDARLVLASLVRCRDIIENTTKQKFVKQQLHVGDTLATWVAAMTTPSGGTAFSTARGKAIADDLSPDGLLSRAAAFDAESLTPAISAALGSRPKGGRLAWQVSLPEAFHHDANAKVAVMLPDWDVRKGRTHVDYSREEVRMEIFAGRAAVIAGQCQTLIEIDDVEQQACGDWIEVCEYSDDDVHYLEIEQPWTGGILLQRQWMLLRDDRCLLFADAVLPSNGLEDPSRSIRYACRLPMPPSIDVEPEAETREVFLSDNRRRALVIPLSASEWRIGPTDATLKTTDDQHLLLSTHGNGQLYAPLWFDFQQRRFRRKRTWRQLTVADRMRIVNRDEATAYRVQMGSEQWVVYRSLGERCCRSVLGKHLVAGFYSSRFDPSDGSHDPLVTVDDSDADDA